MKEAILHILKLIGAIFLIVLAAVLLVVLVPIALMHQAYISITRENRKARDIMTGMKQFFTSLAASIDQFGNTAFAALFNDLLLKKHHLVDHGASVYLFGNKDETISEVLGWNQQFFHYNISPTGRTLIWLLDLLDSDHCFNAYLIGKNAAKEKVKLLNELTGAHTAFAKAK
jgi:hypothetical protein